MEETKRAAIYCRLAQVDDDAMELQKKRVLQFAAELGHLNPIVYADNGASGITFDRPAFSAINADIAAGKIGAVVVLSSSRIGRNLAETLSWIGKTKRNDVALKAWDGSLDCDAALGAIRDVMAGAA
ncbi:MAG: recombinase family protein [Firmicutes bacterium]|nr:recombinase family protein [Bacillota bacterium]